MLYYYTGHQVTSNIRRNPTFLRIAEWFNESTFLEIGCLSPACGPAGPEPMRGTRTPLHFFAPQIMIYGRLCGSATVAFRKRGPTKHGGQLDTPSVQRTAKPVCWANL